MSTTLQPDVVATAEHFRLVLPDDRHLANVVRLIDTERNTEGYQLDLHPQMWSRADLQVLGRHLLAIAGEE
jgi:hypothetical protein